MPRYARVMSYAQHVYALWSINICSATKCKLVRARQTRASNTIFEGTRALWRMNKIVYARFNIYNTCFIRELQTRRCVWNSRIKPCTNACARCHQCINMHMRLDLCILIYSRSLRSRTRDVNAQFRFTMGDRVNNHYVMCADERVPLI